MRVSFSREAVERQAVGSAQRGEHVVVETLVVREAFFHEAILRGGEIGVEVGAVGVTRRAVVAVRSRAEAEIGHVVPIR